jgi:hypothetical protein
MSNIRDPHSSCLLAAMGGHLHELQYLHEQGCPWDESTCSIAARFGNLDCLRYAHEHGCPWNSYTCHAAIQGGHLDCLRYAYENGCLINDNGCINMCTHAIQYGQFDCLQYVHERGCPMNETCLEGLVRCDYNKKCWDYACEHGITPTHIKFESDTFESDTFELDKYRDVVVVGNHQMQDGINMYEFHLDKNETANQRLPENK